MRITQTEADTPERSLLNSFGFDLDPIPVTHGVAVVGVDFGPDIIARLGSPTGGGGGGGGGIGVEDPGYLTLSMEIGIPTTVPLPTAVLEFPIYCGQIMLLGPYVIHWEIGALEP